MLFVGICDDNSKAREELAQIIQDYCKEKSEEIKLKFFCSGEEVVEYCFHSQNKEEMIDILFLDIEMTGMNGVECKNAIQHGSGVWRICFTTSHAGYVFDAFSIKTIGYLVKPLVISKVIQILENVRKEKDERKIISYVEMDGSRHDVHLDDIAYIQADGSYVKICFGGGSNEKKIISKKLGQIEKELKGTDFVRCHKSYLINMANVKAVGQYVMMINKEEIPIGRAYRSAFTSRYRNFAKNMIMSRNI